MAADLGPLKPKDTYQLLLQLPGWDGSATCTLALADGTALPISFNNTTLYVNGVAVPTGTAGDALTTNPLSQFAATTSLQLKGVISDETGSGALVFATSPTLITPVLGAATATSINGVSITGSGTLATSTYTLTLAGTASISGTNTGDVANTALTTGNLSQFASTTSAQLATLISDETGTGVVVFSISPSLVTPLLGTPTSGTLTNCTGYTTANLSGTISNAQLAGSIAASKLVGTDIVTVGTLTAGQTGAGFTVALSTSTLTGTVPATNLGSGSSITTKYLRGDNTWQTIAGGGDALTSGTLAQFAATTSLELKGVISDETGSGALVFATSPTFVTPLLGTPTSGVLTNCTGLPQAGTVGLTTADSPQFTEVNIGHATDTTLARVSAGVISVEGNTIYAAGGTDVSVADGGTGRSTGTTAYALIATGTTATGAQQTLASGATTEILVGGGASALPVWTTVTGTDAPVRATSPTLVTPLLGTPTSGTLTNCTGLPPAGLTTAAKTKQVSVTFGDGSTVPTANSQCWISVPFSATITKVRMLADASGSAVINVWKDTYANYPPVVGDKITSSAPPTISSAIKSEDSTLTGWTTSITSGDILLFNLDSITTCKMVTLSIEMVLT